MALAGAMALIQALSASASMQVPWASGHTIWRGRPHVWLSLSSHGEYAGVSCLITEVLLER